MMSVNGEELTNKEMRAWARQRNAAELNQEGASAKGAPQQRSPLRNRTWLVRRSMTSPNETRERRTQE
jgi:hypothetical protein